MVDFESLGIGLRYGVVQLATVDPDWVAAGKQMASELESTLRTAAIRVEHIGSTAVPGILAKPVLDFAAGIGGGSDEEPLVEELVDFGWVYRGDAGDQGGHVLVLEVRPWVRVAHLHIVDHGGPQWRRYLALRDLLLVDPQARTRYEQAKVELSRRFAGDNAHRQYTQGKGRVVNDLLDR